MTMCLAEKRKFKQVAIVRPQTKTQIYKCPICDTIVEVEEKRNVNVLYRNDAGLHCCLPMELITPYSWGDGNDYHVPEIERMSDGIIISVKHSHPMKKSHRILWIELISDNCHCRHILGEDQSPEVFFPVAGQNVTARVLCNTDGLWVSHLAADAFSIHDYVY